MGVVPNGQAEQAVHMSSPSKAQSPTKHMATDLFDAAGEKWIVLVDRYSGYAWTAVRNSEETSKLTATSITLLLS